VKSALEKLKKMNSDHKTFFKEIKIIFLNQNFAPNKFVIGVKSLVLSRSVAMQSFETLSTILIFKLVR